MQNKFLMCLTQQARLQRGNLLLKQGKLDEAESDFKKVVSKAIPPFKAKLCWGRHL